MKPFHINFLTVKKIIAREIHDHEVFLSFMDDSQAEAFIDWLGEHGVKSFQEWTIKHGDDYE